MKMWKILTPIAICLLLALFIIPSRAEASVVESGFCGDYLTWTLDDAGVLTISGTGHMGSYESTSAVPWYDNRSSIQKVVIENGITNIAPRSFYNCSSLTEVSIPASVTYIGEYAFYNCSSLLSVTIPDSVVSIGYDVFRNCTSLKNVTIGNGIARIADAMFWGCNSLTSIIIPEGVTTIGISAFYDCTSLTSITIPDSVTMIYQYAFENCISLTDVHYGGTRQQWDNITKAISDALKNATIHCTVAGKIGDDVFWVLDSEGIVTISGTGPIKDYAYSPWNSYLSLVKKVVIEYGVTTIGGCIFENCRSLTEITIPSSVTAIGRDSFENCYNLTDVYYCGTQESWSAISVSGGNTNLFNAAIHFVEKPHCDVDGDWSTSTDDAVYLLLSVMFGTEDYPVPDGMPLDFDGNGKVNTDDAVYLLLHVMFGEEDYPLVV